MSKRDEYRISEDGFVEVVGVDGAWYSTRLPLKEFALYFQVYLTLPEDAHYADRYEAAHKLIETTGDALGTRLYQHMREAANATICDDEPRAYRESAAALIEAYFDFMEYGPYDPDA